MANFNSQKRKNLPFKNKGGKFNRPAFATEAEENEAYQRLRLPNRDELEQFGLVTQLMGGSQIKAICEDGIERNLRIPGKMKKKFWIRENDIVIVKLWDFQPIKGDIVWRYMGSQVGWLKRNGKLGKLPV